MLGANGTDVNGNRYLGFYLPLLVMAISSTALRAGNAVYDSATLSLTIPFVEVSGAGQFSASLDLKESFGGITVRVIYSRKFRLLNVCF